MLKSAQDFNKRGSGGKVENYLPEQNAERILQIASAGAGGGEANTASNQGTDGVGVYDTKVSVDLQFRHVAPASSKITVVLNGKDIDLDIAEAQLSLANLGSRAHSDLSDAPTDAHHPQDHNNTYHSTNYHSEADGTGVATVHSDITNTGSQSIITTNERNALHPKQHVITATADHTSTATSGQILKADANGLPIDASNTDTDVASAVSLKHAESHDNTYHSTNYEPEFSSNNWKMYATNGSAVMTELAVGTSGQFLIGNGATSAPSFQNQPAPISHNNTYHSTNYEAEFSKNTAFNKDFGTGGTQVCVGDDSRLSNSRTPTQHALDSTTYHTINTNTTFNATTTKHGFLKLLDNNASNFMNGQGNWAVPAGSGDTKEVSLQHVEDTGLVLSATKVITTTDESTIFTFGRSQIGYGSSGFYAGTRDYNNTTNYGFHNTSDRNYSHVNALTGVRLKIGGNTRVDITDSGMQLSTGARVNKFDTDVNLAGGDTAVPTSLAVLTKIGALIAATDHINAAGAITAVQNEATLDLAGIVTIAKAKYLHFLNETAGETLSIWTSNNQSGHAYIILQNDGDLTVEGYHRLILGMNEPGNTGQITISDGSIAMTGAELSLGTQKIVGVVDPVLDQGVATKKYVDDNVGTSGDVILTSPYGVTFSSQPADDAYSGVIMLIDTTGCNAGDCVYIDGNNSVAIADATDDTKMPVVGICVGAGRVLIQGAYQNAGDYAFTAGQIIYMTTGAGVPDNTAPSANNNMIQVLGVATGTDMFMINISLDMVKVVVP